MQTATTATPDLLHDWGEAMERVDTTVDSFPVEEDPFEDDEITEVDINLSLLALVFDDDATELALRPAFATG